MIAPEIRRYVIAAVVVLACIILGLAYCSYARDRAARTAIDSRVAQSTGKALDKVAEQTPVIRQEQQEKERAVDEIQGSDQRLPDGYGSDLQRLRHNRPDPHS